MDDCNFFASSTSPPPPPVNPRASISIHIPGSPFKPLNRIRNPPSPSAPSTYRPWPSTLFSPPALPDSSLSSTTRTSQQEPTGPPSFFIDSPMGNYIIATENCSIRSYQTPGSLTVAYLNSPRRQFDHAVDDHRLIGVSPPQRHLPRNPGVVNFTS